VIEGKAEEDEREAGDLHVEQPARYAAPVNLKTAKALGVTIPPSLPPRADQVIE
jgi:putative ABC transport system substrate-binding protein